jgi:hypothetical protein
VTFAWRNEEGKVFHEWKLGLVKAVVGGKEKMHDYIRHASERRRTPACMQ